MKNMVSIYLSYSCIISIPVYSYFVAANVLVNIEISYILKNIGEVLFSIYFYFEIIFVQLKLLVNIQISYI